MTMITNDIQALAEKRGMPVARLLQAAGIDRSTWWRWKTGRFQPRAGTVERIMEALNTTGK